MAENANAQERTERATPKRRARAREEGNLARSVEIASVAVFSCGLLLLSVLGPHMTRELAELFRFHFDVLMKQAITPDWTIALAHRLAKWLAVAFVPFGALVGVAALAAHVSQTGFVLTLKPLFPKFERLSPVTGFRRIFSRRGAVEFLKSLIKLAIVGTLLGWALLDKSAFLLPLVNMDIFAGYGRIIAEVLRMATAGGVALAILAILDLFFQRWDYEQHLRMTRQELKEEHKQTEGDPQIRARIRTKQQELSRKRMMQDVRTADVVVTNPVHVAVALKYEPAKMSAPRVVAKGARLLAKRIREIAQEAGIPVVEDPPLARALYDGCKLGQEVPLSLYRAVAELLAFVYRNRDFGTRSAR
jgi:flagellar biosynthetic protein FlhB